MRAAAAVLLLFPALAWAGVTPTGVTLPADIGLQMAAQVQVPWTRSTPGVGDTITMTLPPEIDIVPASLVPAGCTYDGGTRVVTCTVPDGGVGATGTVTLRLKDALALVDIRVLDHLIVGDTHCVSLAERGAI